MLYHKSPFLEAVVFQNDDIGSTMLLLCLLYFCATVHAASKLPSWSRRQFNTKHLFLLSMTTTCGLRLMCFAGFCLLDASELSAGVTSNSVVSSQLDTYATVVAILFDLPDFMLISTYVLLVIVWAEAFLGSRSHWLSAREFKYDWHCAYLVFNLLLYGTQLCLYAVIFFSDLEAVRYLYVVPACATFLVPLAHLLLYIFLSLTFAGFPTVSAHAADRVAQLTRVTAVWTAARFLWATAVLTSIFKRTVSSHLRQNTGVAMVSLFFLCEIVPFLATLDSDVLRILDDDEQQQQHKRHNNSNNLPHYQQQHNRGGRPQPPPTSRRSADVATSGNSNTKYSAAAAAMTTTA